MLSPNELLDIANTMYGSRNMKRFIEDMADNGVELPIFKLTSLKLYLYMIFKRKLQIASVTAVK